VFGFHLWSVRLLSVILGLATLILLHRLSRALGATERAAALLVLLLGTDYFFLGVTRLGRMEALLGFLLTAFLLCLDRARKSQSRNLFLLAGALSGLSLLTHPLGVVTILALLVWCFPGKRGLDEPRDWQTSSKQVAMAGATMVLTLLPYVVFILREGVGEFWQQMVIYQRYCYIRQGFWGGPFHHAEDLWRLLRTTVTWEFFFARVCIVVWLAWPGRTSRKLTTLVVLTVFLMLFAYPSTYINYWVPAVYIFLAVSAATGKLSTSPPSPNRWFVRIHQAGVAIAFLTLLASSLFVCSYRLLFFRNYDPDQSLAQLRSLVEEKAPGRQRILGSPTFLFAFPEKDFHSVFAVASTIDLRGLSWREALSEVSTEVIVVDSQLASGVWPAFPAPPDGLQEFLRQHGHFLGAIKSPLSTTPTDAEVYAIDPAVFQSREAPPRPEAVIQPPKNP